MRRLAHWTRPPALQPGERLRLTPGGPLYVVGRVNECAAYLTRRERREFWATDPKTGEGRLVVAESSRVEAVSVHAFVYREEE